jgi:hypothetical protein
MQATQSHVGMDLDSLEALQFSRPRDMISLHRFAQRFGYEMDRLEALSHVTPGTARANPFNRRVQSFMRTALELVATKMLKAADLDAAIAWFKSERLPAHGGQTPEEVVADGNEKVLLRELH